MDALGKVFILLALCLFAAAPALSQETAEPPPKAQGFVVTSVNTCLDQLDPADAADIRANYAQTWQECQKRLVAKREKEKMDKVKAVAAGETKEPETPRNYVRVQKTEDKMPQKPAEEEKKTEDVKTK